MLGGWQLNGIVTLSAGTPFTVSTGRDTMLNFQYVTSQRDQGSELPTNRSQAETIDMYFDPTAFVIPVDGTFGNTPRNFLIGPGSRNVDLSLFRTFTMRQNFRVQLRVEAFNAFNFVNLGNPQIEHRLAEPRTNPHGRRCAGDAARAQNDVLRRSFFQRRAATTQRFIKPLGRLRL